MEDTDQLGLPFPSNDQETGRQKIALGPEGYPITRASLPSPRTERWVARRKAEILAAVRGNLITAEEACEQYCISREEFDSWRTAEGHFGLMGLRTLFRKRSEKS